MVVKSLNRYLGAGFLGTLLFLSAVSTDAQTIDSDFQVWNETTLSFPVIKTTDKNGKSSDKVSLLLFGSLRLGQNRLFPVDGRIGGGFDYRVNKYVSLSPTYVYRRSAPQRNSKEYEQRIRFDATVSNSWKHFGIKDRNRVEYRLRNSNSNSFRYRNKFTFQVPVKHKGKEIFTPFIANEVFYDFSAGRFSQNEASIGFVRKFNPNTSAEFFYLRRDTHGGHIRFINAIGVNLKIRID